MEGRIMTNFEAIRNLDVRGLARFLCTNIQCSDCPAFWECVCDNGERKYSDCLEDWLKKETDDDFLKGAK